MCLSNPKYYAGVGSRETPPEILQKMRDLAGRLAQRGYILRSGAADGADSAFEAGCDAVKGAKDIWLPWPGYQNRRDGSFPTEAMFELAATLHPAWENLGRGPRALHARNTGQVLGGELATPVSFVLCYTKDGCEAEAERTRNTGGTGTAIVLAARHGIPVFNLAKAGAYERLIAHVLADCREFHPDGGLPQNGEILTFGSNLAGRHGAGSALVAKEQFGAVYGQGVGRQGQSYGIPTKDGRPGTPNLRDPAATLSLPAIQQNIEQFIADAKATPNERYYVVRLGCALATHADADIAPMFARAPTNCSFPDTWKPWLGPKQAVPQGAAAATPSSEVTPGINIWSGAAGLGGALTNMSERAREKGKIRHSYPVTANGVRYPDSEAAYQALKQPNHADYNDGLMIDLIYLKFKQNPKLLNLVFDQGGVPWLGRCSHFTQAKSARFQSWEGQGISSRFIRNLMFGYQKALSGEGPQTRVVHVKEAPFDVYIGRKNGDLPESIWHNPFHIGEDGTREIVVQKYYHYVRNNAELMARLGELKGKTLGCWCKTKNDPDNLCHGDPLVALVEGREWSMPEPAQRGLF